FPRANTQVLAVPRSMARSCEKWESNVANMISGTGNPDAGLTLSDRPEMAEMQHIGLKGRSVRITVLSPDYRFDSVPVIHLTAESSSNLISFPRVQVAMSLRKTAAPPAVLVAFAPSAGSRQQQQAAGPPQMPPTPVAIAVAQSKPLDETTEYVATLKSLHSTAIQPQIDGQITQIFVTSGDRVAKDAPLV